MLDNFTPMRLTVNGVTIHLRHGGNGAPLMLLHGFPQTHVSWHLLADRLARHYTLVMPDLRGYGDSSKPPGKAAHANYAKRVMAQDMVDVMRALGHARFHLCGHDRGGRVAHRLAIDHPNAVSKLMLIDISPTTTMYAARNMRRFATLYYHWFFLTQPAPLPETLIGNNARYFLDHTLAGWGANGASFITAAAHAEYLRCFNAPDAVHAACEDYRAAATIDLEHDADHAWNLIDCPTRVLWGQTGVVGELFNPIEDWQAKCRHQVTGAALPGGHFLPEQCPTLLLDEMVEFFS